MRSHLHRKILIDPGPRLLYRQRPLGGDLELYLHRELFATGHAVEHAEIALNYIQQRVNLAQIGRTENALAVADLVGGTHQRKVVAIARVDENLLRNLLRLRVGNEVLADLGIEIEVALGLIERVVRNGDTIGLFIAKIRV